MRIEKVRVKIHFYRKNIKIRGIKLWEIIPMIEKTYYQIIPRGL